MSKPHFSVSKGHIHVSAPHFCGEIAAHASNWRGPRPVRTVGQAGMADANCGIQGLFLLPPIIVEIPGHIFSALVNHMIPATKYGQNMMSDMVKVTFS